MNQANCSSSIVTKSLLRCSTVKDHETVMVQTAKQRLWWGASFGHILLVWNTESITLFSGNKHPSEGFFYHCNVLYKFFEEDINKFVSFNSLVSYNQVQVYYHHHRIYSKNDRRFISGLKLIRVTLKFTMQVFWWQDSSKRNHEA